MVETAISFSTGLEVIIIALAIIYAIYIRTKLLRASYYLRQETRQLLQMKATRTRMLKVSVTDEIQIMFIHRKLIVGVLSTLNCML
jgi:hypothetical protein